MTISRDDILKLTVSERLDLIDTIWGSIADDADLPLTDAQRREIDRRLVQYARSTPLLKSWDETRARLERPGNVAVSPARTDVDDLALIEKHIGSEYARNGRRSEARLKQSGVSIWALVMYLNLYSGDIDRVRREYDLTPEEMDAALAYYRQNKQYIDARVLLTED